jgi:hypothetical protein
MKMIGRCDRCSVRIFGQEATKGTMTLCMALVPKIGCPLCWPVLAALCNIVGVRAQVFDFLLTVITLLALATCSILLAREPGERGPTVLAITSLVAVLFYRIFDVPPAFCYVGSFGLLVSFAWSTFRNLTRRTRAVPCILRQDMTPNLGSPLPRA